MFDAQLGVIDSEPKGALGGVGERLGMGSQDVDLMVAGVDGITTSMRFAHGCEEHDIEGILGSSRSLTPRLTSAKNLCMTPDEELLHIDQVIDRLDARFPDLPRESIEQVVRSAHAHFANGRVRDFVPLLVERLAREKLQGLVPVDPVVPVVPLAAPTAGAETAGAEVIARRRRWSGWLRGWYPDTRTVIVVAAPEPVFGGSDRR